MIDERKPRVTDRRRQPNKSPGGGDVSSDVTSEAPEEGAPSGPEDRHDYLADLQRLQAEFDNYRKRTLKEQTARAERATAGLVRRLLPVLDDFERALEHAAEDTGIELVYKAFRKVLEDEGLEEIETEGVPFDPRVHEAAQLVDDPQVGEPVVRSAWRRGYRMKGQVLRPAMVVVARPPESSDDAGEPEAAEG